MAVNTILLVVVGILLVIWIWGLIKRVGGLLIHLALLGAAAVFFYYLLAG